MITISPWWCHRMETFSTLLALCAGNSPVTGEFPAQRPVTSSFDAFFDLCLNKRLNKQSWGWWFETPSCSLWRHCNARGLWVNVYVVMWPNCSYNGHILTMWMRWEIWFFFFRFILYIHFGYLMYFTNLFQNRLTLLLESPHLLTNPTIYAVLISMG